MRSGKRLVRRGEGEEQGERGEGYERNVAPVTGTQWYPMAVGIRTHSYYVSRTRTRFSPPPLPPAGTYVLTRPVTSPVSLPTQHYATLTRDVRPDLELILPIRRAIEGNAPDGGVDGR